MQYDELVESLLGGNPTAAELARDRKALRERLRQLHAQPEPADPAEVRRLRRQVRALTEAEAIAEFVELQVKRTLDRAGVSRSDDEES
jgi:cell fate (sporulation/competence/biofilm development) regulator YlbF (YheA/YmcA/DUF963 family)